jgi:hypothetical protein
VKRRTADPASDDIPRRVEGLDIYSEDDGWIVYHGANNRVHHLNASAAAVLELCTGELTVGQIAQLLSDAFGASGSALPDVVECVATLRAESLVR